MSFLIIKSGDHHQPAGGIVPPAAQPTRGEIEMTAYKFATDSESGTIEAASFAVATVTSRENINALLGIEPPAATSSFGAELSWNWTDGGVVVRDGEAVVCEFATRFASRDGLRVIDAIRKADVGYRVQVSDHNVQVFCADGSLAAHIDVAE